MASASAIARGAVKTGAGGGSLVGADRVEDLLKFNKTFVLGCIRDCVSVLRAPVQQDELEKKWRFIFSGKNMETEGEARDKKSKMAC